MGNRTASGQCYYAPLPAGPGLMYCPAAQLPVSPLKAAAPGASGFLEGKPMRTRLTLAEPGGAGGGTACSSINSCK